MALKAALKPGLLHDGTKFKGFAKKKKKGVKELRQAKDDYFIKLISRFKGNIKLIWDNINRKTKRTVNQ